MSDAMEKRLLEPASVVRPDDDDDDDDEEDEDDTAADV